ncbi:immunoglobulin variable region used by the ITC63B heavy chain [Metarhizium brunneum]
MADALRPDNETYKFYYEAGYRLWHSLCSSSNTSPFDATSLDIENAFPQHPYFPPQLELDRNSSTVLYATGTSTWETSNGSCNLPSLQIGLTFGVTIACPTAISLQSSRLIDSPNLFDEESKHMLVLTLAWAYVLSARWTEIIPGASNMTYTESVATRDSRDNARNGDGDLIVDLGDITYEAARWWAAILAPEEGWGACIFHNGRVLKSPWSVKLESCRTLALRYNAVPSPLEWHFSASFSTAMAYVLDYTIYHGLQNQSRAAFAAALLLPTRHRISKQVRWPRMHLPRMQRSKPSVEQYLPPWGSNNCQLDRLLALSCNTTGVISLLCSTFIEPDIPCNVCGAWIQGAFAILDTQVAKEPHILAQMLMCRAPNLNFLWLGGILMNVQHYIMKWARPVAFQIDLHSAAWTNSYVSFIQKPVSRTASNATTVQRSDEARLMFLSQADHHSNPPLVPFTPFGSIALKDCILEVQMHVSCPGYHGLRYAGWAWNCRNNTKIAQDPIESSFTPSSKVDDAVAGHTTIHYDNLDRDKDCSESMTRNMFKWLREADGFPVAERAIREHEWISGGWSSEEESAAPEGDGKSTTNRQIGPWICRGITTRCNTI